MKIKLIFNLLATALCLALTGCKPGDDAVAGGQDGTSLWRLKEGVLTIEGGMQNYTFDAPAPWQPYYQSITQVVLAEGVHYIGTHAFDGLLYLEKVSIPASVQSVGNCAFLSCHLLSDFEIAADNPVLTAKNGALFAVVDGKNTLVSYPAVSGSYAIPADVEAIGDWAFACCAGLTAITIPGSVESIGASAFWTCESLETITIGRGVKTIGENAFDARSLHITTLTIPDSVEQLGLGNFACGDNMVNLTMPFLALTNIYGYSPVTKLTITSGAIRGYDTTSYYSGFTELKEVVLTEGVTGVEGNAFRDCAKLEIATIPANVRVIDEKFAFRYCEALRRINVSPENPNYASIDGVLFNKAVTSLLLYPHGNTTEDYTIPDGVTTLVDEALAGMLARTLTIPASVTTIGDDAFAWWSNMTSVRIGATTPPGMRMQHNFSDDLSPTLYVPSGCREIYEEAYPWNEYFKTVREQ